MKTWIALFLILLAAGVGWGIARDIFSRERGVLRGTVIGIDLGNPTPKWFPATAPRYKVRLPDGRIIEVATKNPHSLAIGADIAVTEWMTPWGQVWYTQRD